MMEHQQAQELLEKYEKGLCTPEERAVVETWFIQALSEQTGDLEEPDYALIRQAIYKRLPQGASHPFIKRLYPYIAAASVLLILSFGGYFLLRKPAVQQIAQHQNHDIAPGSNKAILTLADGRKISLTDAKNGKLAQQGSTAINKTVNG